jgi:hypothetical protein
VTFPFSGKGAGPTVFSWPPGMSDSPTNPIQQLLGNWSPAQVQLVLQPLELLLGSLVVEELVHGLLHVL